MIAPVRAGNPIFSTEVGLSVEFLGQVVPVSTVEPDRLVFAEPRQLEACDGVLVITVNGEPRRTPIRLAASPVPAREFAYTVR